MPLTGTRLSVALAAAPDPTPIATGASPVDADPSVLAYGITTGGTAGQEELNLPYFEDGAALSNVGRRICIFLLALTDPGDTVKITVDGGSTIDLYPSKYFSNAGDQRIVGGVKLTYAGSFAVFVWTGFDWFLDWTLYGDTSTLTSLAIILSTKNGASPAFIQIAGGNSTGDGIPGGGIQIVAGNASVGDTTGANVTINSGDGSGDGFDGNIVLTAGNRGGGSIKLVNLPTADPLVAGAIWADPVTHILKISVG